MTRGISSGFSVATTHGCPYMDHATPFKVLDGYRLFHRFTKEGRTKAIWVGENRGQCRWLVLTDEQIGKEEGGAPETSCVLGDLSCKPGRSRRTVWFVWLECEKCGRRRAYLANAIKNLNVLCDGRRIYGRRDSCKPA